MKVAIIQYWLLAMRGGEKVLEQICALYPDAVIYTHLLVPEAISDTILRHEIHQTFISRLPRARSNPQKYLPLMPRALEALDLTDYDLVISLEAGPAKGVITRPDALHLCYCHSPMRYLWDQYHFYYAQSGLLGRLAMRLFAQPLRVWDAASATRVDAFAANSAFVSRRIAKAWGRKSEVIHPPVDAAAFHPDAPVPAEEFYLYAGELNQYKRPEIAVEAFTRSGKPLIVIGDGGMRNKLEASAGPNVTFLGKVPPQVLKDHFSRCRALVYPGIEDFGIVPLEVAAAGRPVLAFGQGGALETVIDGVTGLFFAEQSAESLLGAVDRLEDRLDEFDSKVMMAHAATFTADRFRAEFTDFARRAQERLDLTGNKKL